MNIYEEWCKQLGIEPLPKPDKLIIEHPDVQKLIIQYSQLQTKYDTLKQSHDSLKSACACFMKFANTDLPKGMIRTVPGEWLDRLKAETFNIKQALAAKEIEK